MQKTRRGFLQSIVAAGVAPVVVPSTVFGATAPSNKLQIGENGDWISTSRGATSVPEGKRVDTAYKPKASFWRATEANRKELITGKPEKLVKHNLFNHHSPWFLGMRSRQDTHVSVEEANVSTISCILGFHAMNNCGYEIKWNPETRKFVNPADAARFTSCHERAPYSVPALMAELRKKYS